MAETSSDAFLEGRGIPVGLPEVNTKLEQLWGPAAERLGGPEPDEPNVTRVVLGNLIVERLGSDSKAESLGQVLETVVARFPCRTIVLRESGAAERRITAEVSAVCHLPDPGRPQVCSERIVLTAGAGAADMLPGAVRPLLESGLPMILWWTTDPTRNEALFRELADGSFRVLLDLPDPGASVAALKLGLDRSLSSCARDAVWYGLVHWRELIAQFFDARQHLETLGRINSVRIEALSPDPTQPPRLALWLAAWLAGQLDWKTKGEPTRAPNGAGSRFRAEFEGPGGPLGVEIQTEPFPEGSSAIPKLLGVTITAGGERGQETFRLRRPGPDSSEVRVQADSPDYCRLPSTVSAAPVSEARRVSSALEFSRFDPPFEKALPIMLWMLEGLEKLS